MRFSILGILIVLAIAGLAAGAAGFWYGLIALAAADPLALLGLYDLRQTQHSLLRNYPVIAHMRWLFEVIRPEIRQYLIESDADAFPFSHEQRSLVYQRAKQEVETVPFGTPPDVYKPENVYLDRKSVG